MKDRDYEQAKNLQNAVSASILTLVSRTMKGRDKPNDKEFVRKMLRPSRKKLATDFERDMFDYMLGDNFNVSDYIKDKAAKLKDYSSRDDIRRRS